MPILKRLDQTLLGCLGVILAGWLLMQPVSLAQSLNNWPNPRQQSGTWISDRTNLIPWTTEHHLNRRITLLAARTGAEIAIATLPQLPSSQSAHDLALDLFNTWGVGNREANTGVLLFVSQADRRIEIITGKGLGEILPDAEVSRLIQQTIVPAFQRQEYATGIEQGTVAIAQRLEAQLPATILPRWLPAAVVWVPWLVAVAGLGLAITGSGQAIAFSLSRVQVPVPSQGLNTQTFGGSSEQLSQYTLPQLLTRLFTPNERAWVQEIPTRSLGYVWCGGWLSGIGLMQGFWLFLLMHPEAALWQRDAVAWGVGALGSGGWLLGGVLVSHRFVQRGRLWRRVPLEVLVMALVTLLGSYLWVYRRLDGGAILALMAILGLGGWGAWWLIVGNDFQFKRPRDYCCDRTGTPIQELTAEELEPLLSPDEKLAQSMGTLEFRGWRTVDLASPLARESVYLVRRNSYEARRPCGQCQSFAVERSERTVEKTIETTKKKTRKQKEKITQVVPVKQTVITCRSCGAVTAYDQPTPTSSSDLVTAWLGSGSSSPSQRSASREDSSRYDDIANIDYGSAAGSDFGGGSSDGSGAGSDW
jgi:uncharacterized protein